MAAAGYPLAPAQQPQPQPQPQVMTAQQQHATMMMQPLANAQGVLPGGAATPQKAQQLLQRARSLASSNGLAVTQAPHIAPGQVFNSQAKIAQLSRGDTLFRLYAQGPAGTAKTPDASLSAALRGQPGATRAAMLWMWRGRPGGVVTIRTSCSSCSRRPPR